MLFDEIVICLLILLGYNSLELERTIIKYDISKTVDIDILGLYTLGSHRKILNNDQKKEYKILFRKYFLKSFSSRLSEYSNPKIDVQSQEKLNENYTIVSSILVATETRPEVKIQWRIYTKNPEKPLIRDLIVEGLSLARTQKEEFASILSSNNNDSLSRYKKAENDTKCTHSHSGRSPEKCPYRAGKVSNSKGQCCFWLQWELNHCIFVICN